MSEKGGGSTVARTMPIADGKKLIRRGLLLGSLLAATYGALFGIPRLGSSGPEIARVAFWNRRVGMQDRARVL
jgi:hypothetical protein